MKRRTVNIELETSRGELLHRNANKYLFFAWTLDRLVQYLTYKKAERINIAYIDQSIYQTKLLKKNKKSKEDINRWLQEMILIGLIRLEHNKAIDQELLYITEKGIEEYKNQKYHVIAAQLLEANASRKMAKWAVIVAIISIIITIGLSIWTTTRL